MTTWYKRKDGTYVFKVGKYRVLEIFKRPHKGYCCLVIDKGFNVDAEGYFTTSLPKKYLAIRWGIKKAKEHGILNDKLKRI